MKKISLVIVSMLFILYGFSQPQTSPHWNDALCPEQDIVITFDLPYAASGYVITSPMSGCTVVSNIDAAERATVRFSDKKETHKFTLYHSPSQMEYEYVFSRIKTIDGLKPTWNPPMPPYVTPLPPDYDDAMDYSTPTIACGTNSFTYTAPVLKYRKTDGTEFGNPMAFYEWLPPKGWKINGTICDGTNPIMTSAPSASITPDAITGGEIKFRAMNDCGPSTLKKSSWYRIKILGRPDLVLTANGVSPAVINCPSEADRIFTLENTNDFTGCITGYKWSVGSDWLYNGSPAPSTITTSTPTLTLKPIPGRQPGNVAVKLLLTNGVEHIMTYACPIIYNQCVLSINPVFVPVMCSTPEARTFTVSNTAYIPSITGYIWDLGSVPNGWIYNGNDAPASITTSTNTLTLVGGNGITAPHNVTVTPQINGQPSTPSTSIVQFTNCCAYPPSNLTATQITANDVTLNWNSVPGATYYLEVTGTTGATTSTSGTNSYNYFGQAGTGQFRVKGYCSSTGYTEWSEWKSFTIEPPPVIENCVVSSVPYGMAIGNSQIRVYWNIVPGALSYNIKLERYGGGTPPVTYTGFTASPAVVTAPIANGSSYWVSIQTICPAGTGPWVGGTGSPNAVGIYRTIDSLPYLINVGDYNLKDNELKLFPNPSTNSVTLSFISHTADKTEIKIIDQIGKIVFIGNMISNIGINNKLIDLSGVANGTYFIIVNQGNTQLKTKLIITK